MLRSERKQRYYVTAIPVTDQNGERLQSARSETVKGFMDWDQTVSVTNTRNAAIPKCANHRGLLKVTVVSGRSMKEGRRTMKTDRFFAYL